MSGTATEISLLARSSGEAVVRRDAEGGHSMQGGAVLATDEPPLGTLSMSGDFYTTLVGRFQIPTAADAVRISINPARHGLSLAEMVPGSPPWSLCDKLAEASRHVWRRQLSQ